MVFVEHVFNGLLLMRGTLKMSLAKSPLRFNVP